MEYWKKKAKHAYKCYKKGKARQKVYAVVEKDDKFLVLKGRPTSKYKYFLSGGTVERKETIETAIKREILEEMNINTEFVRVLGVFDTQSKWTYKGQEFLVNDHVSIVYTKFISYGKNKTLGVKGEFEIQDIVAEVDKNEMINNVYEFVVEGINL